MFNIINGAPRTVMLGINDKSTRQLVFEPAPRAIHTPLSFLFAQWGPTDEPQLVYGSTRELLYGDATFDMRSKYATHATLYANLFNENANSVLIKRVVPKDTPDPANVRLYIDYIETTEDEYERNEDGSFKTSANGDYLTTGEKIPVIKAKFVKEYIAPTVDENGVSSNNVGKGTITVGDQVIDGVTSKRVPIFDYELPYQGSLGNDYGFRVWGPTVNDNNQLNINLLEQDNVYPFRFAFAKKNSDTSSSSFISTVRAEPYLDFTLKPDLIDKANDLQRYLGDILSDNYQDLTPSLGFPVNYGPFRRFHIYQEYIDEILELIFNLESNKVYTYNELTGLTPKDGKYMVNLFGGVTSKGIPYQSYRFAPLTNENCIRPTEYTTIYASGGGDGTLTKENFEHLVADEIKQFNEENSKWQDIIGRPCSFFWDSGFSMETKYQLGKFISLRKNTVVILSTHVDGEGILDSISESARATSLISRVRSYAESEYFGTPTCRAVVCTQSGKLIGKTYKNRVSLSYDLASKVSRLANSQRFKSEYLFNKVPTNVVDTLTDISNGWVPEKVRSQDWANGMMWVEQLEDRKYYFPAFRTAYKDDTSILTSLITTMAMADMETIGDEVRRMFSGSQDPIGTLLYNVEEEYKKRVEGRYSDLFVIKPIATQTVADEARGYSWTLTVKVYANNPRTVMTLIIESHRSSELIENS